MISVDPSDVVQKYLEDLSLATGADGLGETWDSTVWPSSTDTTPDDEAAQYDRWVTIKGTGSDLQGREFRSGAHDEKPAVQIFVRGLDETAQAKGYAIQDALRKVGVSPSGGGVGRVNVTVGGGTVSFRAAHLTTALSFLRTEEVNRRKVYVMNFKLDLWET
jgi:hypothetical protein